MKCSIKTKVKQTSLSRTDSQNIGSSGPAQIGNGSVLFSCPLQRIKGDVSGVGALLQWSVTPVRMMFTETGKPIWTSGAQAVILCVGCATTPNVKGKCCVLDADSKDIILMLDGTEKEMEKSAGAANPQKKGNGSSSGKSTGKGKETRSRGIKAGSTGRSKSSTSRPENG